MGIPGQFQLTSAALYTLHDEILPDSFGQGGRTHLVPRDPIADHPDGPDFGGDSGHPGRCGGIASVGGAIQHFLREW